MSEKNAPSHCPRSGRFCKHRHRWVRWIFPITGLFALIWFLIRVVPKPSRAAYPCQQTAMPLASGFVIWLVGLVSSVTLFKRARQLLRSVPTGVGMRLPGHCSGDRSGVSGSSPRSSRASG